VCQVISFSFQSNEGGRVVTSMVVWISFDCYEKKKNRFLSRMIFGSSTRSEDFVSG
jgi:hypothetical protein